MPRVDILSTNFTGGELSPRLYGRPDLQKYNDALKAATDVVCLQHGGVVGRPGSDYLGEVKDSSKATRLIPFVYSRTDAYVIEAGDGYFRFWKNGAVIGGGTPYEVTTPYTTATVFDVDYTQGADTMFLALGSVAPYRLQRFADNRWTLGAAPFDPMPFDEIGMRQATAITLGSASVGSTTATAGASLFLDADVGRILTHSGGMADITGVTSATVADVEVTAAFSSTSIPASEWVMTGSPQTECTPSAVGPVGSTITLTLDADGWRSVDAGKYVSINGGLCKITSYTSALIVDARVESVLSSTTAAPANAWTLESAVWNAGDGYPMTLTLHGQRLVAASTSRFPQTIWGSRIGLYLDFTKGTLDDDAYSFELGTDEINPIQRLSSGRDLIALTYGGAWTLFGSVEKPITPTNVRAKQHGKSGAESVRPEQVDDDLFYAQRGGTVLRSLLYSKEAIDYDDDEASTFSEHLVSDGIAGLTYQQTPERVMWLWKDDGTYCGVTTARKQNIRAFTPCTPGGGGVVESMVTIPEGSQDSTYMIVRRTVDGTTKRYIERMNWSAHQDCRVTRTPGSATVTGLGHLEGKTVSAVADGVDLGDFTVDGGEIELPRAADSVTVGLRFTPTVTLLPPEVGTGMGATAGMYVNVSRVRVLFKDTVGCDVNGEPLAFREFGADILDESVQPFTGWKELSDIGWDRESGEITLSQPQSYPWCVLAVVRRLTNNPG